MNNTSTAAGSGLESAGGPRSQRAALELHRQKYLGYGPTLAAECLEREDGLVVPTSTLRKWLSSAGLWQRQRRRKLHRRRRARREHYGELLQLDGSHHAAEDASFRGPKGDNWNRLHCFAQYRPQAFRSNTRRGWLTCSSVPREIKRLPSARCVRYNRTRAPHRAEQTPWAARRGGLSSTGFYPAHERKR